MEYNKCEICGADKGRAGMLIGNTKKGLVHACLNCHDTRKTGKLVIHTHLRRTSEELEATAKILADN